MTNQSTTKTKISEVTRIFKNIQRYSVDHKFVVSLREEGFAKDEWALYKRPVSMMIADSMQLHIGFDNSEDAVPFNVQVADVKDIMWAPMKDETINVYVKCIDGLEVTFNFKPVYNDIAELDYKSDIYKICNKMFDINL